MANPPVTPPKPRPLGGTHNEYGRVHDEAGRAGTPTLVHVHAKSIRNGDPAVTIRTPSGWIRCCAVDIKGPSRVGQWKNKAEPEGPNSWVETRSSVVPNGVVGSGHNPAEFDVNWMNVYSKRDER